MTSASTKQLSERAYWWGAAGFALMFVCALAALPHAARCCSIFPADQLAFRDAVDWQAPGPAITVALMDWPMGFRLLLITIVTTILCASAMIVMAVAVRREMRADATAAGILLAVTVRVSVSSTIVSLLYLLAIYGAGFFGISRGLHNLAWLLGIPMLVAWMGRPSLLGCALGLPLAVAGFACLVIISITLQIPLD